MVKMGCKLKIYQTGKFKVWKMVKMSRKLNIYQTGKFQSVENGEDGLQIKKLSNWKISKYRKW
jgi:hypothetical protein